jgi:outer membrane protein TolC
LPQLSVQGSQLYRKDDTPNVLAGVLAEESSDGRLNLSQVLYSDDAWANLRIQQYLQLGREAALEQIRLDTIQASTTAFLNVLRTESQLRIRQDNLKLTKANLELARDRVRLGSATASDQYRWESQLATDRATLLTSRANFDRARESLNRLLHRPLTEQFQVQVANIADPFFMTQEEYEAMVDNPRKYQRMTRFSVEQALLLAPELTQIKTALDAKQRELTNLRRAYWLPDFTVSGQYTDNFNQQGGAPANADLEDWQVSVNATLPIFSGGSRRSEVSRAGLEVKQLEASFASVRERTAQRTRAAFHDLNAVYVNIELSESAAESSRKNLELVTDSYSKGVVSIIELVDAQNSSLAADLTAANARYDFLVVAMELQRSIGAFDFLMPADVQAENLKLLREYLDNEAR